GKRGRLWLAGGKLPQQARESVEVCLRMIDSYNQEIQKQNLQLSEKAGEDRRAQWLMTIPGIGECSAMMLLAEIGDIGRFGSKQGLCSYAGLGSGEQTSELQSRGHGVCRLLLGKMSWIMVEAAQV